MKNHDYFLRRPQEQAFYRNLVMWLSLLGLAYPTWWGYEKPNKLVEFVGRFLPPCSPLAVIFEIAYIIVNRNELTFEILGVIFAIFPVTCIIFVNLISSRLTAYRKLMPKFMDTVHLHNYKNEGFVDNQSFIKVERMSRYTSYFLIICIMIDWFSWVSFPIVYNIKHIEAIRNETMSLNVFIYIWTPFDYKYNVGNWICLHCMEAVMAWAGCSMVSVFNSLVYIFVYHIIGHIKALKEKIKIDCQDVTNHDEMSRKLNGIIKYHIFIKNMFKEIQMAFGLNVTSAYVHNLIGDSLLLYQVMFGEKASLLSYGLMFLLYMGGLILISFVLEEIKIQSDDISIIMYNVPWENMSVRNQKTFLILFSQVQKPLEFAGMGNLRAGVKPMISIVKSTFSYYVMLKSSVNN